MSNKTEIPQAQAANNAVISGSPNAHKFLIPSPVMTRKRTESMSEKIRQGPLLTGTVKNFCRNKGHGFIMPENKDAMPVFVHISDVESEYVPKEGDLVTYKLCPLPINQEKCQAVHVSIKHLREGTTHETWQSSPSSPSSSPFGSPKS